MTDVCVCVCQSCSELAQNMLQSVSKQLGEVNARKKHMMKKVRASPPSHIHTIRPHNHPHTITIITVQTCRRNKHDSLIYTLYYWRHFSTPSHTHHPLPSSGSASDRKRWHGSIGLRTAFSAPSRTIKTCGAATQRQWTRERTRSRYALLLRHPLLHQPPCIKSMCLVR